MKIALTGASGQLGTFFKTYLTNNGITFDPYTRHEWDILSEKDSGKLLNLKNYDVLINCAAYTDVEKAESDQQSCFDINANALKHLSEICKTQGSLLVHFSTDYIFDGESNHPYQEQDKPNPLNVYGASKLEGERIIQASGCKYFIGRVSWLFGGLGAGFTSKLETWKSKSNVLKITSDEISTPTFASSIPKLVLYAINKKISGLFHLNNTGNCSRYEWAKYYAELRNWDNITIKPVAMSQFKTQAKRPGFSAMCNERFQRISKLKIPHWKETTVECIQKTLQTKTS